MADAIDEFALVCESCGYALAGLPRDGKCPECGRPVAESLPERRVGSAWQQGPGREAWLATGIETIRRPDQTFAELRIELPLSRRLFGTNIAAAAAAIAGAFILSGAMYNPFDNPKGPVIQGTLALLAGTFALTVSIALILAALTLIESVGVRLWWRRSRSRITPGIATAVCAHASVGWFIAGVGMAAGTLVLWAMQQTGIFADLPRWARAGVVSIPPVALVAGLLIFETLVYIGIRRCRFANRMPPTGDA